MSFNPSKQYVYIYGFTSLIMEEDYAQFNLRMPRAIKKAMLRIALEKETTITTIAQKLFEEYILKESSN